MDAHIYDQTLQLRGASHEPSCFRMYLELGFIAVSPGSSSLLLVTAHAFLPKPGSRMAKNPEIAAEVISVLGGESRGS